MLRQGLSLVLEIALDLVRTHVESRSLIARAKSALLRFECLLQKVCKETGPVELTAVAKLGSMFLAALFAAGLH